MIIVYNPAFAREIIVDNNGSGADFRSIQEAVNNSSSGDTVIVMPGIYNESIIVNITSLTIRSESKNSEILVKSPEENKSIFLITANNVTLSGFNITRAKGNYTYYPSGICLKNTRNCKITGNTLFENYLGVYLVNADQNTISENLLFDSSIYLNENSNVNNLRDNTLEEGSISLSYSSYNTISENSLFNGSISMGESSRNNLTNNTIEKGSIFLGVWCSLDLISKNKISDGWGISIACCGGGDIISDNLISNCSTGVSTYDHGIDVVNNSIIDCYCGIDISQSPSRIHNNTLLNCSTGITVMDSSTDILNNIIISSAECGLSIPDREFDERIYNNYFNNIINVRLGNHSEYTWNNSRISGTNIVGGPYLGGNYWANPNGTGFSETCTDSDGDWICDSPYNVNKSDFDFLPLASMSRTQKQPIANFSTNTTQGLAPLAVQFTDFSQHAITWNWDFDNDWISDSTEKDPAYEYIIPGNYTVNLTVSNANGKASKTQKIIVHEAEFLPVANFNVNTTSGQAPLSVLFTDLSQNVGKRTWDFNNDGIIDSINKTSVYKYEFPGTYIVNLTVSNSKVSFSKLFPITASPVRRVDGEYVLTEYKITYKMGHQLAIYGDRIVWTDSRNGNSDIYMYDLSTSSETQINGNESIKGGLAIFGDKVVWAGYHDEKSIIYMYNLSTSKKTQIATSSNQPYSFAIYEDRVVWAESHNSLVIYMYDFSTQKKIQIATNGSSPLEPVIYGDKIVWSGGRTGNFIYMCVVSKEGQEPLKPVADFSAVPTSGTVPLKVLLTDNSTGGPTSWLWDFGDGINSKHALNATHTFTEPGKYNISLIVTNGNGSSTKLISEYITVFKKE